jgi:Nucleotidyl transferase AbiEii toxin, Type IV TA system
MVQKSKIRFAMKSEFKQFLSQPSSVRMNVFLASAKTLNTTVENVEKDFWVTLLIDMMFNGRKPDEPRLLFKGGTSLSKAFNLTFRFSEDIDITVFKEDLGVFLSENELALISGKKQRAHLEKIREVCGIYIKGQFKTRLELQLSDLFVECGLHSPNMVIDAADNDGQTILFHYPTICSDYNYTLPYVKIEGGAKSALEPHQPTTIEPYISKVVKGLDLKVHGVTTIDPARTFWDKVVILHGTRRWSDLRGSLRQDGHRVSRHYYDLHQLLRSPVGDEALSNSSLGLSCVDHATMYFNNNTLDLQSARDGKFQVTPSASMLKPLEVDYNKMKMMIFGEAPSFSEIMDSVAMLDARLQSVGQQFKLDVPSTTTKKMKP